MPNVIQSKADPVVVERIRAALKAGSGIAVVPLVSLLANPADSVHLVGDAHEATPLMREAAYNVGYAGADWVSELRRPYPDSPVVLVDASFDTPHPALELLRAMRDLYIYPDDRRDEGAQRIVAAGRTLIQRASRKRRAATSR